MFVNVLTLSHPRVDTLSVAAEQERTAIAVGETAPMRWPDIMAWAKANKADMARAVLDAVNARRRELGLVPFRPVR